MTRKQKRANYRIQIAKERRESRFRDFVRRLAERRLPPGRYVTVNFHCLPRPLGMPREELLSKGEPLVGGKAFLYREGELHKLLPRWGCERKLRPTVLVASYVRRYYAENGDYISQIR